MHKNNQTFPSDRSCSCRKENYFLRRKGGYCQWRGDLEWKMFPISVSSSFVHAYERSQLKPSSSVLVQRREQEASPTSPFAVEGPCHSIRKVEPGLASLLTPSTSSNRRLGSGCWEGAWAVQGGRGGRAGIFCRPPPFPQAETIHRELPEFIYLPAHEAFSRNPVLIKKIQRTTFIMC